MSNYLDQTERLNNVIAWHKENWEREEQEQKEEEQIYQYTLLHGD